MEISYERDQYKADRRHAQEIAYWQFVAQQIELFNLNHKALVMARAMEGGDTDGNDRRTEGS